MSSPYDKELEMELPAGKSSDSRDSSAYLNSIDFVPFPNRFNNSPDDTCAMVELEADVSQGAKVASAPSADEAEQGCKSACFWGSLEGFLGLKPSNAPRNAASSTEEKMGEHRQMPTSTLHMDEIEEESASNVESPRPVRSEEDAEDTYFTETLRDVAAARVNPSTVENIVPSMFSEGSADDEDSNMLIDNESLSSRQQIPMGPDAMSTGVEEEPYSHYMSDDTEDEDEVSTDKGCNASEDLNNQSHTPPPRMPIDNEMRKKFARRGLRTISSRGKN